MIVRRYEVCIGDSTFKKRLFDGLYAQHIANEVRATIKEDGGDPSAVKIKVTQSCRKVSETITSIYYI